MELCTIAYSATNSELFWSAIQKVTFEQWLRVLLGFTGLWLLLDTLGYLKPSKYN
jgi:hypothetical protein